MQKARAEDSAINNPIRALELLKSLPAHLTALIKEIFFDNSRGDADKGIGLQQNIEALKISTRDTIVSGYLAKCMWLDREAGRPGNLSMQDGEAKFQVIDSDDPLLSSFLVVLEKDNDGDYVRDFRGVTRILPKISKSTPRVGAAMHIWSESYRKEYKLEKHYSL